MAAPHQIVALAVAVGLCVAMAVLGSLLTGNQLRGWFTDLRTPRWQLPLWAFIGTGIVVYVLDAIIAYRLLTVLHDTAARVVTLTALVVSCSTTSCGTTPSYVRQLVETLRA